MNENGYPVINDSDVGMDPSIVTTIETLDVLPPEENTKKKKGKSQKKKYSTVNPDKKPHDKLKKVMFTIIIILLMCGVSFGVYYYLSLGQGGSKNKTKTVLLDKQVLVGYGLDGVIDMSGYTDDCVLDTSNVNTNKVGDYTYTIACDNQLFEGKVSVIEMGKLNYRTHLVYAKSGSTVDVNSFITSNDQNYTFSFSSENTVNEHLKTSGGIYPIEITVNNSEDGSVSTTFAQLIVVDNLPKMYMNCKVENEINQFLFDNNNNDMRSGIFVNKITYTVEEDFYYNLALVESGKVETEDGKYNVVFNPDELEISYISLLDYENLLDQDNMFPSMYSDLKTYYENIDYSCGLSFNSGF